MTGASNNINDLLGIGVGSSTKGASNSPATKPGDATFSALLSMLSGLGLNTAGSVSLLSNGSESNTDSPALAGLFPQTNLNSINNPVPPAIPSSESEKSSATRALPVAVAPISIVGLSSKTLAQLVASQPPQQATLTHIREGKFTILSATVMGGKLDLHLINKDNPKAELHVTLPVDLVQTSSAPSATARLVPLIPLKGSTNQSSPLGANSTAGQTLTDLISQLNITEVAIEKAPSNLTAGQQTEATSFKFLNAENPATPAMIAVVPATQLKALAKPQANQSDSVAADLPEPVEKAPSGSTSTKPPISANINFETGAAKPATPVLPTAELDAQPLFRTAAVRIGTRVLTQETPFVQTLLGDSDAAEISPFKLDLSGDSLRALTMVRPTAASATTVGQAAVRITLPQNLTSLLDNPGRSINIKLEPDYLGPARLTLSMRGESLSAKLTVDTLQAKAAVENSITQLTDQLAKAGIKVDHFDVSMHGGGAGNQTFHRPHDWFSQQRPRIIQREDEPFVEHLTKVEPSTLPSATYINRRSVNLYA